MFYLEKIWQEIISTKNEVSRFLVSTCHKSWWPFALSVLINPWGLTYCLLITKFTLCILNVPLNLTNVSCISLFSVSANLQYCAALYENYCLLLTDLFEFQAVIKQFGGTGYESSDVMVIDEVEMQRHQQLEKLYRSTRAGKVEMV